MNSARRFLVRALEDHPTTFLARVRDLTSGALITQARLSAIDFSVFDIESDTPNVPLLTGAVNVVTSIFDTLQLDDRWGVDDVGYNFAHVQLANAFNTGARTYELQYEFQTTSATDTNFGLSFTVQTISWRPA